jgi:hypothetical protein
MRFVVEIQRQVFGELLLDDLDVLSKDLVVEIESLLDGCIFVEVATERDKEPGSAGRERLPVLFRPCRLDADSSGL